jgi:NADH-quinone oxidoreductase subunit H
MDVQWIAMWAKAIFIVIFLLQVVPIMIWVERRGSALMQNRRGPNRIGPLGLFHAVADAIKFMFKEDPVPSYVSKFYYVIAPLVVLIPAFMAFSVVPFASSIVIQGTEIRFQVADLNVGLIFIFAIASLGVYGIIMAAWSSNSKYALMGGLRSSSQMISYELTLGLSVVGVLMISSSLSLYEIVQAQGDTLFSLGPLSVPKWGIFTQPLGFLLFLVAAYAETNRLPFDLPEGESEIVAGYHLEYGSMKMALFYMAEYVSMFTMSAVTVTLFFGGWHLLPGFGLVLEWSPFVGIIHEWFRVILEMTSFFLKVAFFMWLFVWVRWTIPRFRYDQLMGLGWKVMFELALINVVITAALIYFGVL